MSSSSRLTLSGGTSASSVFGAALMWAWWDLAVYSNIFHNWIGVEETFSGYFFVASMLGAGVVLFLFARLASKAMPLLQDKTVPFVVGGIVSSVASIASVFAAQVGLFPIECLAAVVNGLFLGVLIAIWGSVMTERGAQSAIINSSLAITTGIVLDAFIVYLMRPLQAALLVAMLPLASVLIFCLSVRKEIDPEVFSRSASTRAARQRYAGPVLHREFYGLSLLFILGLAVAEIAFNYMNDQLVSSGIGLSGGAGFNYLCHVARGLGAFACFLFVGPLGMTHKRFFWIGGFAMSFCFATLPFWNALSIPIFIFNYINMACFAIVVVFVFGILGEISYERKVNPLEPMCFGCIFITAVDTVGVGMSGLLNLVVVHDSAIFAAFTGALGFILVFAIMAVFSEGQRYLDASTGVAAGIRVQTDEEVAAINAAKERRESFIADAGLSQRERAVLDELVRGKGPTSIAQVLGISENTVKTHMQNTYRKFGVHSKKELLDLLAVNDNPAPISPNASENDSDNEKKVPAFRLAVDRLIAQYKLTPREADVFMLLARGYRSGEIQERLSVSASTVHTHVTSIYTKMDVHSFGDLNALVQKTREDVANGK